MRISKTSGVLAALSLCASACGDADNDERGGSGASAGPGLTTLTAGDTDGEDQGDGEDQADGDADGPGGDADGPDGDADDDGNDADGGVKYDTNTDDVVDSCDGMMTGIGQDFSYIWIANSPESTISKINTQTLVEEGRYVTRDTPGNPSRTSVALSGHVAVANRSGGVTKYHAWGCDDPMNTSTGPNDVYAFGADGCLAWSTNMVYNSQRPVAWTPGVFNDDTCAWEEEMVWTAGYSGGNTVDAILLDGETGVIVQTIAVNGVKQDSYGAYGGASDSQGNFWFSQLGDGGWLVRVDKVAGTAELWPQAIWTYGMAVDGQDRPWLCGNAGVARFDYATGTFATSTDSGGGSRGCMADATHLWLAGQSNVRGVNLETMGLEYTHAVDSNIHGTSIDFEGYIWGASRDTRAYRVDVQTGAFDTVDGLNSPYTYSDMTGFGLANSAMPPR
ncbi:MAG: hypothetical protein JKY37_34905 [Nannocystaceae bacterium]|nr:hypothetical protein [Nannocystaceae bacterium]